MKALHSEINAFSRNVNSYVGNENKNAFGYVFETWHEGTFNIDSVAKRTPDRVSIPPTTFASADVSGNWANGDYQLKCYKDAWSSAKAHSTSYYERYKHYCSQLKDKSQAPSIKEYLISNGVDPNIDINLPQYQAQARLIPSDQIDGAICKLKQQINHDLHNLNNTSRESQVFRYQDTLKKLTDHVSGPNGAQSMKLTEQDCKVLCDLGKSGKFDPSKYDITVAKKADYLYLMRSNIVAGTTGAALGAVIKSAPELVRCLNHFFKNNCVDKSELEALFNKSSEGAADGFIKGFSVGFVKDCCSMGYFGEPLQKLSITNSLEYKSAVIMIVSILTETAFDSISMAKGTISVQEFYQNVDKRVFIASVAYASGIITQSFVPELPYISYIIGSFFGGIIGGLVFSAKETILMSVCVNHGYTFFGLVKQDYEIPQELASYLGIETYETESYDTLDNNDQSYDTQTYDSLTYDFEKIDIIGVKRGIIGVRKIGFVPL